MRPRKNHTLITSILSLVALAGGCGNHDKKKSPDPHAQELVETVDSDVNKLRPFQLVNQTLKTRMIDSKEDFDISRYLESDDGVLSIFEKSLKKLLGAYDGDGLTSEVVGADSNAMNMMLWRLALMSFATDIAAQCNGSPAIVHVYKKSFERKVKDICAKPERFNRRAFKALWVIIMGYDAANEVRDKWLAFVARAYKNRKMSVEKILGDAVFAALYSPHFLIEH